ncbi:MAG TPA: chromosomal replication initiator protein DnaA [Methylovirgula sp.]|nr:chromosomal replication initiator protein DnaA [Methylovirgula sp.]
MLNPRRNESRKIDDEPASRDTRKEESWAAICRRLRAELGEAVFTSWFARLELEHLGDNVAHLTVPTKFLKNWIQTHYSERILTACAAEFRSVKQIAIGVRSSSRPHFARVGEQERSPEPHFDVAPKPVAIAEPQKPAASHSTHKAKAREADGETLTGSPLDKRLNFSTFLVGRSNQLAYASAQEVGNAMPGETLRFNPLYIHAAVGLGKTHLLQAIAHAATGAKRRVIYLTAERFMHGFVCALKAETAMAFKEKLRSIDILIIDDVQFLQGKSIQQEFCHTLNALIDARRQIVIAADRPPADLESLDERVRSRFAGGLCVEMGALDESLRIKLLEARVAAAKLLHPNFEMSPAVLAYVASVIQTNGRDLDGAVNRLVAHACLTGLPLSVETAEAAIRDLVRTREPKRVKIEDIQKLVASHYNVTKADILSARRTANVVRPRQIAMYLAKTLTPRSLPEIGRRFGGRDHTTVLHAVRKIEALAGTDGRLSEEIDLLKRLLTEN